MIPKVKCECGQTYYGWALLYTKCYCDKCREELKYKKKEGEKNENKRDNSI
ncbi:MAG: hypothetical protein WDA59_08155 [Methanofastidiosum sp.]|jgi:hypothetical protein